MILSTTQQFFFDKTKHNPTLFGLNFDSLKIKLSFTLSKKLMEPTLEYYGKIVALSCVHIK